MKYRQTFQSKLIKIINLKKGFFLKIYTLQKMLDRFEILTFYAFNFLNLPGMQVYDICSVMYSVSIDFIRSLQFKVD